MLPWQQKKSVLLVLSKVYVLCAEVKIFPRSNPFTMLLLHLQDARMGNVSVLSSHADHCRWVAQESANLSCWKFWIIHFLWTQLFNSQCEKPAGGMNSPSTDIFQYFTFLMYKKWNDISLFPTLIHSISGLSSELWCNVFI